MDVTETVGLTEKDCWILIKQLINFPYATICKHDVICRILSKLEENGNKKVTEELARAVVSCKDHEANLIVSDILNNF